MPKLTATDRLTLVGTIDRAEAAKLIQHLASALASDDEVKFRIDNIRRWDDNNSDSSSLLVSFNGNFGSELFVDDSAVIMGGE